MDSYLRTIKNRSFYRTCAVLLLTGGVLGLFVLRVEPGEGGDVKKFARAVNVSHPARLYVDGKESHLPHRKLLQAATLDPDTICIPLPEDEEEKHEICQNVHMRSDDDEKCSFTLRTSYCQIINGFINYVHFVYCDLSGLIGVSMTILVIWWVFLFVSLAVTADDFFCPSMVVIVKTLGLSPNVAGVTFLAFGNGAPDLFSAIVAFLVMRAGDAGMAVGGLFGAGMFVTAAIVGTMAIVKPFKVTERPFLRDDIFYMGGSFWMLWIIWREKIFLYDAVGFVILYIFYVTVVVISGSIYKRTEGKARNEGLDVNDDSGIVMVGSSTKYSDVHGKEGFGFPKSPTQISLATMGSDNMGNVNPAFETDSGTGSDDARTRKTSVEMMLDTKEGEPVENGTKTDEKPNLDTQVSFDAPNGALDIDVGQNEDEEEEPPQLTQEDMPPFYMQFLIGANPINVDEWSDMKIYLKIYEVFKSPAMLLLKLTVPVVLYEDVPLMNWNRYLNCFQLLFAPMVCAFLINQGLAKIGGVFPVWALLLIIGACLAIPCYFTSVDYKPPKYHEGFGYMAFFVAMVWIYVIATEIVNLLTAFGVVLKLSNGILGLTLLAWGNSVGDFVADMVMAGQGFPRMAFSACFGAPIFHLLLGTGIAFIARMTADGVTEFFVRLDTLLFLSNVTVLISMVISLICLTMTKFWANRIYGIILCVFYGIFFILTVLTEANVIPSEMR